MMKNLLLIGLLSLAVAACEQPGKTDHRRDGYKGKNTRDREMVVNSPYEQSESEADRALSQKIRQAIMSDSSLSSQAKNIKVTTEDGVVTLNGSVLNDKEKDMLIKKIKSMPGVQKVEDDLEVNS